VGAYVYNTYIQIIKKTGFFLGLREIFELCILEVADIVYNQALTFFRFFEFILLFN